MKKVKYYKKGDPNKRTWESTEEEFETLISHRNGAGKFIRVETKEPTPDPPEAGDTPKARKKKPAKETGE